MDRTTVISSAEVQAQLAHCRAVAQLAAQWPEETRLAFVDTYGCQQNEADSERIRGYLKQMGFGFTDDEERARIIVINTCAIREHAEQRVFGNVGALVHVKRRHPEQLICLCGCMVQQPHAAKKLRESYRHVDLVFGPHALWKFPEMVHALLTQRGRTFSVEDEAGSIAEGIPVVRQDSIRAWVSIMYGCNNFCAYCIVPYVRGRERSRRPEDILAEVRQLVEEGYKDITLLGQNVNSYGKDLEKPMDFSALLEQVNAIPGDFLIRFMTSHPKDATQKLFETMARCEKVAPVLHLPFQAGNDRVLKVMNRRHTRAEYLEKIKALKALIPDIVLTSDIIVGFPGETAEEFEDTLKVLEEVRFDALFTFIYSPRHGTPAASMDDPMSREEKLANFNRLTALQDAISEEKHAAYTGKTLRCLIDGLSDDARYGLTARTPGNRLVRVAGDPSALGQFREVKITGSNKWSLFGELA
ncbi:MAG: tRNA (N6-isopentenyl adenosine(37)-C2)-methylthiotransferase MiaB [Lawsonibacter sp.]|jgi:tRNA-2-methylthio-N6-dimethylallyladenosine synthase|uniref:tRNA (N6-isopentenyl adenosine(37)-C2)-methylthiotransferase MiaB n=1 Tax=Lawsonibacter sp. JLR.KK007 TaxID=3114293 RepID=UPI00216EB9AD|nr:tRNA (N6-isopentenyl adenosine(37)-C2)-methylthiotransferase MiaB [Lawsonibacter sp.]MCI9268194.1 tRNA (N6-isopentenyl adenosine(37)-C2)-methylthiotransferase MiaB [Lawsonibacter sp.]